MALNTPKTGPTTVNSLGPVVVTGGNGYIASHIIEKLLAAEPDISIHSMDVNTSKNRFPPVTYHQGDISKKSDVDRIMDLARPATVFHTASPEFSGIPESLYHPIIADGTRHLLDACKRVGTRALIHTSSSSTIHDNISDLIDAKEDWPILRPPQQKRVYSLAKADAEEMILAANRADGDASLLCVNVRPGNVFGERDMGSFDKMLTVALEGRTRFQMGDGNNPFDFMYTGNMADLHLLIARRLHEAWGKPVPPKEQRVDGEAFNATNDDPRCFWDFQRAIAAAAGKPVKEQEIVVIPKWVGLTMGYVSEWYVWLVSAGTRRPTMTVEGIRFSTLIRTLNMDKTKRVLGFRPAVSVEEGLERTVKWFMEHRKVAT